MKVQIGKYVIKKDGIHPVVNTFIGDPGEYLKKKGSSLEDKVALVTGGYKGIGLAIVKNFLLEGARVIFTGRNKDRMEKIYRTLDKGKTAFMEWDVADIEHCESFMTKAFDIYGSVDILVNNAGITGVDYKWKNFLEMDEAHISYVHNINVIGTVTMCQTFFKFVKNTGGKIINIISNAALRPATEAYAMSKWALLSYTLAAQQQFGRSVLINAIAPGPVRTDMTKQESIIWDTYPNDIPNKRIGLPEEIAALAVRLAGKSGNVISGKVFLCDGGQVLK
jgi:3-oxoacyl-[acyl-carrier protein] reductase